MVHSPVRKVCRCARPDRCSHAWYVWWQSRAARSAENPNGRLRFSIDKHLARHVETREDALNAFEEARSQVLAGTFVLGMPAGTPVAVPTSSQPEPPPAT